MISGLRQRFIMHLALPVLPEMNGLPDKGAMSALPSGAVLQYVPAHFLHAPGNFHAYDSRSKSLFAGDLGAALVPDDDTEFEVTDLGAHIPLMEGFHRRYLGSTQALKVGLNRVRGMDIERVCPQHGKVMSGENVGRSPDWLDSLEIGMDFKRWGN